MARIRLPASRLSSLGSLHKDETFETTELTGLWGSFAVGVPLLLVGIRLMTGPGAGGLGLSGSQLLLVVPIGVLLGVGLLAAVAYVAAEVTDRTAVILRPALGMVGSWILVPVMVAFLISWAALELEVAGRSLAAAVELLNGTIIDRSVGTIGVAVLAALFLVIGPQRLARTWIKWFAFWVGLAVMLVLVWRTVGNLDLTVILEQTPGTHFWLGVDLVVGAAVFFFPLVADTARFAHDQSAAASSVGAGYGVPALIALLLGGLAAVTSGLTEPTPTGMVTEFFGSSAGVIGAVLALFWLVGGEADQPFAFLYSAATSIQTLATRAPIWASGVVLLAGAAALSLLVDSLFWIDLIDLLLAVLVPVLGIFLADFFIVRRRSFLSDSLYDRRGAYRGVNWVALPSLVLGFVLYQWISPAGPAGWVEFVEQLIPGRSPADAAGVPPVMITLAFAFTSYALIGRWRIEEAFYMSKLRI
ncbi:MAG: cytosine permease [Acidimicrobiia bacterium]|nr:cytosine permease [Acidimicrobiia bacterium]